MTKKIFAMFLAVLMVVSMLPTSVFAASCPGAGNHTALNCNNTVLGVTEPTCKVPGFTAYKCNDCGEEFHDNVTPATGAHTYVDADDKAPTCEEAGYTGAKVCSGCGDVKAATTIPSLSNGKYNCQWEITNPQINCLTGGEQIWKCVNCGAEKTVKIDKKDAHSWSEFELVTAATATADGLAKRTCACGAVDEVVVYYSHDCTKSLITVSAITKTCTTDGLAEHKECRICGTKYNAEGTKKLTATQIAALTVKAGHTYDCPTGCALTESHANGKAHVATCVDTILHCSVCDQTVAANVAHEYDEDDWVIEVNPTCVKSGYKTCVCANCGIAKTTEILSALGHKTVEVTVPATCVSIGYTFTYCTRLGCQDSMGSSATITDKNNLSYSVQVEGYSPVETLPTFEKAEDRVLGGFYLALSQTNTDTVLYFTGKMDGNFLDASENVAEAVLVYLERLHVGLDNQYYMFFYDAEGVKTYISVEGYINYSGFTAGSVKLSTTPGSVWNWNSGYNMMTTTVACSSTKSDTFFLGTYNQYETISASSSYYLGKSGQFYAYLCATGVMQNVNLTGYTFNYDAGANASNHAHNLTQTVLVPAECEVAGAGEYRCTACGWSEGFEIPAGHNYVAQTTGKVNEEDAYKAPSCVPGYIYEVCTCGEFRKVVLAGYGHVMGSEQKPVLNHETTSGYKHTDCQISGCDYSVKGAYMVWEGVGKVYNSWTAAATAHGNKLSSAGTVIVKGDCTTAKRTQYKCECGVWVVVEETGYGYGLHLDMVTDGQYKAPSCTEAGGFYTFYCDGCKAYVGSAPFSATPGEVNWNTEAALGHNYVVADDHECEDCDSPNYTDVHSTCSRCTSTVSCFVLIDKDVVTTGNDLCDTTVMEYYWCELCQDEHIRSFVKAMGHEWKPVLNEKGEINYTKAPTCTAAGEYTEQCAICGDTRTATAAPVAHENKAGEKFFNKCTDTVADRHCVNCCACGAKGASHDCVNNKTAGKADPCDCVIKAEHQYNSVMMPSTCTMPPYLAKSCPDCGDRTNEVMTKVNGEDVIFCGHKPAAIDMIPEVDENGKLTGNMVAVKYPGFVYEEYTYTWYTVKDGEWVKNEETYTAKFIERKAASYTEEGYDHFYCSICKSEEKNVKAKLTGLGFEIDVKNALGVEGFTYGSLIEVTVSVNGNNAAVHGFNFAVVVGETEWNNAKFVGYEPLNDDFNLVVTDPEKTDYMAIVSGFAANDASGKQQNITINGKTELVKLFYRVADEASIEASEFMAYFMPEVVSGKPTVSVLKDGVAVDITANTNLLTKNFKIRSFLDFNNDGIFNTKDLYMAMSMITLEHADGKTYDVTVDVNKDGVVDLEDLSIAYNYFVGNYEVEELLVMGISAEEVLLLDLNEKTFCNSSVCGKEIDADAVYCPFCGNHQ